MAKEKVAKRESFWADPITDGGFDPLETRKHGTACCDCGLMHWLTPAVKNGRFGYIVERDERITKIFRQSIPHESVLPMISRKEVGDALLELKLSLQAIDVIASKVLGKDLSRIERNTLKLAQGALNEALSAMKLGEQEKKRCQTLRS